MEIYQVGGSVRDEILGLAPVDKDYVVVGATIDEFLKRYPKAKKVGRSFPVFLVNGNEYAFARKEKKTSAGYRGFEVEFSPDVTLEEDLARRDITINSIAKDIGTGELTDPFNGIGDIRSKRIVHVTEAFSEDPLRVYRVARFAARFCDFSVDEETIRLMNSLKDELDALSPERVWAETFKALTCDCPSRFFKILKEADVLDRHFPEIHALIGIPAGPVEYHGKADCFDHTMKAVKRTENDPLLVFSVLCHDFGKAVTSKDIYPHHYGHDKNGIEPVKALCKRLKVPKIFEKAALLSAKLHMKLRLLPEMRPKKAVNMLKKLEKFGNDGVFDFLKIVEADSGENIEELRKFIDTVLPATKVKLPEEFWNLGPESTEKHNELMIKKYVELKKRTRS